MSVAEQLTGEWFQYFPGHYRWSAAVCGVLANAPYGGSDIGEVDRAARSLRGKEGDDAAWFAAWRAEGERIRHLAENAEKAQHNETAGAAYLRACNYFQIGERFKNSGPDAEETYRISVECFRRFAGLSGWPKIECVEVPYETTTLAAYFVHGNGNLRKKPCVVFFDGLDITKELQYLRGVPELVRRGMSVLIVDGPGSGASIRLRGLHLRYDYEIAGSAAFDYLLGREDVDSMRVGIMAVSLGGYYAPRCASLDHRFKACVAWGAMWNYHEVWKRRIEAGFNISMSVAGHHILWILGVKSLDQALKTLEPFKLDGVVQEMKCSFLLTHGIDDEQVPLKDAEALFNAVGSADKTFRIFTREEGGTQHCQRDHLQHGITVIADWLLNKL